MPDERWKLPDFMLTLAEEAESTAQAARVLGLSRAGARYWFEEHGINPPNYYEQQDEEEPRTRMDVRPWQDEAALRYYLIERDCTRGSAGDHLGCAASTVQQWLGEHDIDVKLERQWAEAEALLAA